MAIGYSGVRAGEHIDVELNVDPSSGPRAVGTGIVDARDCPPQVERVLVNRHLAEGDIAEAPTVQWMCGDPLAPHFCSRLIRPETRYPPEPVIVIARSRRADISGGCHGTQ